LLSDDDYIPLNEEDSLGLEIHKIIHKEEFDKNKF
jgi:hypothetical protein